MLDHIRKIHFALIAACVVALFLSGGIQDVKDIKLSEEIDLIHSLVNSGKMFIATSSRNRKCTNYINNFSISTDAATSAFPLELEKDISKLIYQDIKQSVIYGKTNNWPANWPEFVDKNNYIKIQDVNEFSKKLRSLLIRTITRQCLLLTETVKTHKKITSINHFAERWNQLHDVSNSLINNVTGIKSIRMDRFWGTSEAPIRADIMVEPDPRRLLSEYYINRNSCDTISDFLLHSNLLMPPDGTSNYITITCSPGQDHEIYLPNDSIIKKSRAKYHKALHIDLWVDRDEYNPKNKLVSNIQTKRHITEGLDFEQTFPSVAERKKHLPDNIEDLKLVNEHYIKKPLTKINLFGLDIISSNILLFIVLTILAIQIYFYAYLKIIWNKLKADSNFIWIIIGPNEWLYVALRWVTVYIFPPFSILLTTTFQVSLHPNLLDISSEAVTNIVMITISIWSTAISYYSNRLLEQH